MDVIIKQGKYGTFITTDHNLKGGGDRRTICLMKGNDIYNIGMSWRNQNGDLLRSEQRDYIRLHELDEVHELFDNMARAYAPPEAPKQKVVFSVKPAPEVSPLEKALMDALVHTNMTELEAALKPKLDTFIQDTYGILPQKLEIKTERTTKTITGVLHEKFKHVCAMVGANIPVMLTGQAGTGKNHLVKQVADAFDTEFYFTNAVTQEYKLTGFIDAMGKFHETEFYKAFTNGGLFMLDEMDASIPETLVILNAAIANRYFDFPNGRVEAHEGFRVIAAANTFGTGADAQYVGRFQLDAATLDRFAVVEIGYDERIEEAMANGNKELVSFIHNLRNAFNKTGMDKVVSYRGIEMIHRLTVEQGMSLKDALRYTVLKGISVDDLRQIINNLGSGKYSTAVNELAGV